VALTQTRIVGPTTLGSTSAAIYSPTTGTIIIKQIVLTNYSASAATVDLWLLPASITTVANGYLILKSFSLAAYETVFLNTSLVMVGNVSTTGDRLHAVASAATSVNVIMNGIVET